MAAVKEWYDYQAEYERYGASRKPRRKVRIPKETRPLFDAKDKIKMMAVTVIIGLICVGIVLIVSYAASIQFSINETTAENAALQSEIENIRIDIETANNIESIEKKATGQLGMVYPTSGQRVYLTEEDTPKSDFATVLRKEAYN